MEGYVFNIDKSQSSLRAGDQGAVPSEGQVFDVLKLGNVPYEGVYALREDIVGGVLPALLEDPGEVGTGRGGAVGGEALRGIILCRRVDVDGVGIIQT